MTNGAKFRPADHRLHKVLRHQSAHWSVCPGNVSKWSASIAMTYIVTWVIGFFLGAAFFTFGAVISLVENKHCWRLLVLNGSAFSQATKPRFWFSISDRMPAAILLKKIRLILHYFSTVPWRINLACSTWNSLLAKEKWNKSLSWSACFFFSFFFC